MLKKSIVVFVFVLIVQPGCSTVQEDIVNNNESIEGIEEVVINFASTDVDFLPSETSELETYLTVYDNGPGVILDKSSTRLSIALGSDIIRLFNLKKTNFRG